MDKKAIGLRLKSIVLSEGITQKAFAKKVDFSDKYISDIIRGRTAPSLILLERIASVFNVSMDWLLTGKGLYPKGLGESLLREGIEGYGEVSETGPRYASIKAYRDITHAVGSREDLITLPILSHEEALQIADGRVVDLEKINDYCTLYKRWLSSPKDTICIRMPGNSMEPILKDGSIVAINTSLKEPSALVGQLCAIKVKAVGAYCNMPERGDVGAHCDAPLLSIRWLKACEPYLVFMPEKEGHPVYCFSPQDPNPILGRVEGAWTRF